MGRSFAALEPRCLMAMGLQRMPDEGHLFVYGTLLSGYERRALVAPYLMASAPARSTGSLYHLPEGYPAMLADGGGTVVGELLRLRSLERCFDVLDRYEGHLPDDPVRSLYHRIEVDVRLDRGDSQKAWCYVWNPVLTDVVRARGRPILDGDWRRFSRRRGS